MNDTIVAISTPVGEGGIGIVRLSGEQALALADSVFLPKDGTRPSSAKSHTIHYGHIVDGCDSGGRSEVIDEVLLTVMRAPRTYTREDIVEINCHSGIVPLRRILSLLLEKGARLAEPGEFTKRAFLNGRIDLAQAEAVCDLIRAKTALSQRAAMAQLEGGLSKEVGRLREALLEVYAHIEASIDFPEEEVEIYSEERLETKIGDISYRLKRLIETADEGIILREGISIAIVGRPNVGKSSLMNALLRKERAIVTPIPGTTRDCLEEEANIGGIPLKIIDTAGIIKAKDIVTKEALKRSRAHLKGADLILLVLDGSRRLEREDIRLLRRVRPRPHIVVINKIDLPLRIGSRRLEGMLKTAAVLRVSARTKKGLKDLNEAILKRFWQGNLPAPEGAFVTNLRQKNSLCEAHSHIRRSLDSLKARLSPELVAFDMKLALDSLGEITGSTSSTGLLDRIFARFCIGK